MINCISIVLDKINEYRKSRHACMSGYKIYARRGVK